MRIMACERCASSGELYVGILSKETEGAASVELYAGILSKVSAVSGELYACILSKAAESAVNTVPPLANCLPAYSAKRVRSLASCMSA